MERIGRYELLETLGQGGMAEVSLARLKGPEGFARLLVVKRMRKELASRDDLRALFLEEARLTARLSHPNLIQVFELGEHEGQFFIAMELIDGANLGEVAGAAFWRGRPMPPALAAYAVARAADGLAFAHALTDEDTGRPLGIVHRDVSPQNILISRFGDVKISDFGIAKSTTEGAGNRRVRTEHGVVRGKTPYLSPEQILGIPLDGRTDVFSLGVVLFELLAHTRPFTHVDKNELMRAIAKTDAPRVGKVIGGIPPPLEEIVARALMRERDARYSGMGALRDALDGWLDTEVGFRGKAALAEWMTLHLGQGMGPKRDASEGRTTVHAPIDADSDERTESVSSPLAGAAEGPAAGTGAVPNRVSRFVMARGARDADTSPLPDRTIADDRATPGRIPTQELGRLKTNLVRPRSRFIGRKDTLNRVAHAFEEGAPLVTILGPAGMGKTRVAKRFAERNLDDYALDGGIWFADLSSSSSVLDICRAVADALGLEKTEGTSANELVTRLGNAIAERGRVLLVLDNLEQLTAFGPSTIGHWLNQAPAARFLATSRAPLELDGEARIELPPLSLPASSSPLASEAFELFVERAQRVRPDWSPETEAELSAVSEIVRRLDGIPLAIELAAARMSVLTPAQLLSRLDARFSVLGGVSSRNEDPRHATLRRAIDWSWELLSELERDVLAQCSVFHGGFSLDAAEAIIDVSHHRHAPWLLDVLQSLRDRSLLTTARSSHASGAELRFGIYESIRAYAAERLDENPRRDVVRARQRAYFLELATRIGEELGRESSEKLVGALDLELENVLATYRSAVTGGPSQNPAWEVALGIAIALEPYFLIRGPSETPVELLERAIAAAAEKTHPLVGRAHYLLGRFRRSRGEIAAARSSLESALEVARALDDASLEGDALLAFGLIAGHDARSNEGRIHLDASIAAFRRAKDPAGEGRALAHRGFFAEERGEPEVAAACFEQALPLLEKSAQERLTVIVRYNLGVGELERGSSDRAYALLNEAVERCAALDDRHLEAYPTGYLGLWAIRERHFIDAVRYYRRAAELLRKTGHVRYQAWALSGLAAAAAELDLVMDARAVIADAQATAHVVGDPAHIALVEVAAGFLDLAIARQAERADDTDRERLARARALRRVDRARRVGPDGTSAASSSQDVRILATLLERSARGR